MKFLTINGLIFRNYFLIIILFILFPCWHGLPAQTIESEGTIKTESIQLTNGAGAGKILTSDVDGNATWSNLPKRKRTILITPSMFRNETISGAYLSLIDTSRHSCIIFPESTSSGYSVSLPLPAEFSSTDVTLRILYTSSTNSGNFRVELGIGGVDLSGDLNKSFTIFSHILSAPAESDELLEYSYPASLELNDKVVNLLISRFSSNPVDTSTGDFKLLGICLDYFE